MVTDVYWEWIRYVICNMGPWLSHLQSWYVEQVIKRVFYLLIFVIRENEIVISVIHDPLFFLFVNRARDPPVRPSVYNTVKRRSQTFSLNGKVLMLKILWVWHREIGVWAWKMKIQFLKLWSNELNFLIYLSELLCVPMKGLVLTWDKQDFPLYCLYTKINLRA